MVQLAEWVNKGPLDRQFIGSCRGLNFPLKGKGGVKGLHAEICAAYVRHVRDSTIFLGVYLGDDLEINQIGRAKNNSALDGRCPLQSCMK